MESILLKVFLATCLLSAAFATPDEASEAEDESGGRSTRQGMGDTLTAGKSLTVGQKLTSKDGRYYLIYQADGNLAAYATRGPKKAFWHAKAKGKPGKALLLNDGRGTLVLLNAMNKKYWSSRSVKKGVPPFKLVMQNDRNIVIYDSKMKGIWFSRTPKG
eukprot:Em0002g1335a